MSSSLADEPNGQPRRWPAWKAALGLLAVLVVCIAPRVWLIRHTEAIAEDGTLYVQMARQWSSDPGGVVRNYDYHVGYPAVVSLAHRVLLGLGLRDNNAAWDLAGQWVSLAAAALATVAIWLLAGAAFDWRVAALAALVFSVGRKWTAMGADVISDALSVSLQLWGVVLALGALKLLRARKWPAVPLAGLCGLCVGAGYLVRPEALLVVALTGGLLLWSLLRERLSWRLTLASLLAMAGAAAAAVVPYMSAIGGLTKKKSVGELVLRGEGGFPAALAAGMSPLTGTVKFLGQLVEASSPVAIGLVALWLVVWAAARLRRAAPGAEYPLKPRRGAGFLMVFGAAVLAPLWIKFGTSVGYLSHRHTTFLAALLSPLAGAGLMVLIAWVRGLLTKAGRPRLAPLAAAAILVGMLAPLLVMLRPLHEGKGCYRYAAGYLAALRVAGLAPAGCYVLADSSLLLHYARMDGEVLDWDGIGVETLQGRLRKHAGSPLYLVVSEHNLRRSPPEVIGLLGGPGFSMLREFPSGRRASAELLRVYRPKPKTTTVE